jgi:EAL domain-containing protein (putative c-di-GMP-specific phosphodiesterase class I)
MLSALMQRVELETGLQVAIDNDELRVHYQPIRRLDAGDIVAVEALVRWQHPTLGELAPQEFLPIAESSGLIVALDRWVLHEACTTVAAWSGSRGLDIDLHVNVCPQDLLADDYVDTVQDTLARTGLAAAHLVLEITESQASGGNSRYVQALQRLRQLGVRIAIDDFGTGQSTLSRLGEFPVDMLKIDRSFVAAVGTDQGAMSITRAIISMADSLGIALVAEGVETDAQRLELQLEGCAAAQGFLLGRPSPAEVIEAQLAVRPEGAAPDLAQRRRSLRTSTPIPRPRHRSVSTHAAAELDDHSGSAAH